MSHRRHTHVLNGFGGKRGAPAGGAEEHQFLTGRKHIPVIRAVRIDPELQHSPGRVHRARNRAGIPKLPDIPQVDNLRVLVVDKLLRVPSGNRFDLRLGLVDQLLETSL